MRIALLSDIHGNSIALDAVLADIHQQGGVEGYWFLGDLVALGPDPVGVMERLSVLPNAAFVRGNTDRYVTTGEPSTASFAWTQGAMTVSGWFDWLADLPLEMRHTLPDGTRFLGVHAAPGQDDGNGIRPDADLPELQRLLAGCEADLLCVGHTHVALDKQVGQQRVVNLGSVSNPRPPDLRAGYLILAADATGYRLEVRRVEYDRQAVIDAMQRLRHPAAEHVIGYMRGQKLLPPRQA